MPGYLTTGNFPQVSTEVLSKVTSTSAWESALGTLQSSSTVELLPDKERRTFVQRNDGESIFRGNLLSMAAAQWSSFACNDEHAESQESGDIDYYFHMFRKGNVISMCISDDVDVRYHEVNFNFLDDSMAKFTKSYASYRITKAKAYEMDKKFSKELAKLMFFYNENRTKMVTNGAVNNLLTRVDDLKGEQAQSIDA